MKGLDFKQRTYSISVTVRVAEFKLQGWAKP